MLNMIISDRIFILVRARAIQNQCFLVAAAQVASQNRKRQSYGYCLVVDRWGRVLLYMNLYSPLVRTIDIDLRYIEQVREKIPFIHHRRHDLYTLMSPTTIIVPIDDKNEEKIDVVVSPFRYVERFSQLNPEEINDLFQSTQLIRRKIEEYYQAKSLTISYTRSTTYWTNC
ncbi:unnamed protein product [Rotaria sordida]|uniref:CN hydrolase domain-containing protein n=1 Tax=Rotaria sordida TaxID=392033 RepID=A0A814RT87_9BILA|nr:unnamed protein product [Rotaria sordida]CAF1365870.1 unnamed protein product [Rotaria sordida]